MRKIVIVSGFPLTSNPRVVKEATALADAGYDVQVLTSILNPALAERELELASGQKWRATYVIDNRREGSTPRWRWHVLRLRRRAWTKAWLHLGVSNIRQLAYFGPELLAHCLHHEADLYSIHLEPGLWVGHELLKRGRRVGVDFEDWYSEDLLPQDRRARPIRLLKEWERTLLQRASYCWATSHSMASALAKAYSAPLPTVVYNAFPYNERDLINDQIVDRRDTTRLSITWFSQTVGPERGLEDLMMATHYLNEPLEIHLRGSCSAQYREHLIGMAHEAVRAHIYIHPQVPHHQLLARIAEHDVGFAGATAHCPSRDLTITKKLLNYILAGVPVVASETSGQREVAEQVPGAMRLYKPARAEALAAAIRALAHSDVRKEAARQALSAARETYSWERSAHAIQQSVARALEMRLVADAVGVPLS